MTSLTKGCLVRSLQLETRHLVMIELGLFPVTVVVAPLTIRTITAFVAIIFCMAADARHGRLFDAAIGPMARCARGGGVGAQ